MKDRVVVLDGQGSLLELTRPLLERAGYRVDGAESADAVPRRRSGGPAAVVLDACLPCPGGPSRVIAELRKRFAAPILQVSGCHSVDAACRYHPVRADAFLVRPFPADAFVATVDGLVRQRKAGGHDFHGMDGRADSIRAVFDAVRLVAPTESTVLLIGETGTGKEMLARALHAESSVADGPFVPVDCGALSESLLESELFGHVKGAFTGAHGERRGLIEAANGGTLFLDEVGNMPSRLQMLLLRALQERRVRRVGATHFLDVDIRLVAATSRELSGEVSAGRFREDLYYRLRVFAIDVPPLRDRPGDVDRIVRARLGQMGGNQTIEPTAMQVLRRYEWPGNVRELLGVLTGASIRASGEPIEIRHLPPHLLSAAQVAGGRTGRIREEPDGRTSEKRRIRSALRETGGNRTRAAELLGISRTTLWRRMRDMEIDPARD